MKLKTVPVYMKLGLAPSQCLVYRENTATPTSNGSGQLDNIP